jgi:glutamyl-Q tRNA(Asp) synthetase
LIRDADGQKLSKSTRATALRELRQAGKQPDDIRHMVGVVAYSSPWQGATGVRCRE